MSPTATTLTNHLRIWAYSISCLSNLFLDIATEYSDRAELRVITWGFEDIVREIDAADAERPDVVVAGDSSGAYLKPRLSLPVVVINPMSFDVMHVLTRARRDAESVVLVAHSDTPKEVRRPAAAYGMNMVFTLYTSRQGTEGCVLDLRDRSVGVVVGPGLVTDLTMQAGMNVVFLYSWDSVRATFDTALEVIQATHRGTLRRQRLGNLLRHLRDGVIALDAQGRVEAIDQWLVTALGIEVKQVIGQPLLSTVPSLLGLLPDADDDTLSTMQDVNYVTHRGPFASADIGAAEGTVFTFQESRAMERLDRTLRSRQRPQQLSARYRLGDLVGESLAMERVRTLIHRYTKSGATVFVLGESGTGKEMVAQGMHQLNARRGLPFVIINCGAFPEALLESELFGYKEGAFTGACKGGGTELIEAAYRGTLFLDEIGGIPLSLQNRLLRVLQGREVVRPGSTEPIRVDIRVVIAMYHTLTDAVEAGTSRTGLHYRLDILSIGLPPLRGRPGDVTPLTAELFTQAAHREPRLLLRIADTGDAARVLAGIAESLRRCTWADSVRELQNVAERIAVELAYTKDTSAVMQDVLRPIVPEVFAHATPSESAVLTLRKRNRGVEAEEVHTTLATRSGDRGAICAALGISKTVLWRRLQEVTSIR